MCKSRNLEAVVVCCLKLALNRFKPWTKKKKTQNKFQQKKIGERVCPTHGHAFLSSRYSKVTLALTCSSWFLIARRLSNISTVTTILPITTFSSLASYTSNKYQLIRELATLLYKFNPVFPAPLKNSPKIFSVNHLEIIWIFF